KMKGVAMSVHAHIRFVLLCVMTIALLVACGGQAPVPAAQQPAETNAPAAQVTAVPAAVTSAPAATAAAPAATPAAAVPQELIVGAPTDTYRLDPPERATLGMYSTNAGIYESLVRVTSDYQVEPLLATSWEFVKPNTWRFKLRQDVTFH